MITQELSTYFIVFVIIVAIIALIIKIYRLNLLRNKYQQQLNPRYFKVFSEEHIYSTTSEKKREYMILSNRATYILYVCAAILAVVAVLALVEWLMGLMDSNLQ